MDNSLSHAACGSGSLAQVWLGVSRAHPAPARGVPGVPAGRLHQCGPIPILTTPNCRFSIPRNIGMNSSARGCSVPSRPRRRLPTGLRLKQAHRVIVPLSAEEVAQFWNSFRTFRDLALVALMLPDGLRSCEVLDLRLEDLNPSQAQMLVLGKGNKKRLLPLPQEAIQALQNYLRIERPLTNSPSLFVSLKGPQRGRPMTPAGLRSLFRHHRLHSQVPHANPHRFRHTFGADMVRAGISLPALMHLMGHAQIHTTMLYVQLAPQDVWREFARAIQNRIRLSSTPRS